MRKYELTVIVKPDVDAANMVVIQEKIKGILAADGGTIVKTDVWGMRRLGYPIRKAREGQYVHMLVELEPGVVAGVENRVKLVEDILRHLLVVAENIRPAAATEPAVETTTVPEATPEAALEATPEAAGVPAPVEAPAPEG